MLDKIYRLKQGDTIGVAAPCARFDHGKLQQGIACLEDLGFRVHVPQGIYRKKRYLAGDDHSRAGIVNQLFADPGIKGIISARGGFGAMRILEHLDWELIKGNPKLFMGFSDNTAIITALIQEAGLAAVHGPNLVSLVDTLPENLTRFYQTITAGPRDIILDHGDCLRPGQARGFLTGGNMATLNHLIGTRFEPDFNGSILFLEDVGEPAYKIDRMLFQMKMAGLFSGVRGVVTGSFENCENPEYIPLIISEIFDEYKIPVLMGLDSGHSAVNLSLAMGERVLLDATGAKLAWIDGQ